jgi:hypothetical protein
MNLLHMKGPGQTLIEGTTVEASPNPIINEGGTVWVRRSYFSAS